MERLIITDRNNFVEFIEKISLHNIISMEVSTYEGSYLEGINWDYLKYVYNKEKDTDSNSAWIDYTIVYKNPISTERLLSDFDEIQSEGVRRNSIVTVTYDQERSAMRFYTGSRCSGTGVLGYSYRKNENEVFYINCPVNPNPDITMNGFGKRLFHRYFDVEITLIPGIRRNIVNESDEIIGFYEYVDLSHFKLVCGTLETEVKSTDSGWTVYNGMERIAEITYTAGEERQLAVAVNEDVNENLYPLILAIPVLKF